MHSVSRGRELARELIARMAPQAGMPTLAIVAADDPASRKFVQIKRDMLSGFALRIEVAWLGEEASSNEAVRCVSGLNLREDVDAIFIQFPLPAFVDSQAVADAILEQKDIDCSSAAAESRFLAGTSDFEPVAPRAAFDLLHHELKSVAGRQVVITGDDDPFTRAFGKILRIAEASVTFVAADESAASIAIKNADALVITEKLPDNELLNQIDRLPVVLDAGYFLPPRPHNWIPAAVLNRIGTHLTQYGNVGPLTVAHLAASTIRAASIRTRSGRQTVGGSK
jgi:methylenetetrahydrofolate dehydrogenase (NADP+)/methenyltetrahydrofolate cyclohydrolase